LTNFGGRIVVPSVPLQPAVGRYRPQWWWLIASLGYAYAVLLIPPWQFALPGAALDPSWVEVIAYGAREGWQWGRDIAFTYGPLGYLAPNPYPDAPIGPQLAWNAALATVLAAGVVSVIPRRSPPAAIGLFMLILLPTALIGRWAYAALSLLAALRYFRWPGQARPVLPVILAGAAGVFALVNMSSGAFAICIFLLLDASRLAHRRWPIHLPAFVTGAALAYLVAGQNIGELPLFLRACFEFIVGYSNAMSLAGPRAELAAFLVVGLCALGLVAWSERSALSDRRRRRDAALLIAVFGLYEFYALKLGFVRHDLHSVSAWLIVGNAAAAHAAMRWIEPDAQRARWALVGLSLVASGVAVSVPWQGGSLAQGARHVGTVLLEQPWHALEEAVRAGRDPDAWVASWRARRMAAFAAIREEVPLPAVEGTVDIITNTQSSVLAHGMQYRPRPVFQDYAAYTPWLVERNRAHYDGAAAAQYVFFRPETIDNRYPLLDQGAGASELLTQYDPVRLEHHLLVLKRRVAPLRALLADGHEATATFGQWVSLEAGATPVLMWVNISPNLLGHLANAVLRPPVLTLSVRLANGTVRDFRLIDGIAQSGFLLSPLVESTLDFAAVAVGSWDTVAERRVVAFRIGLTEVGQWFYRDAIRVNYASLQLDTEAAQARGEAMRPLVRRSALIDKMAALSPRKAPFVEARNTELYAHAPTLIALPVPAAGRVRVAFGIRQGAWTEGGATDGVCFRVSAEGGNGVRRPLFERCLDPVARAGDRGEQTAVFAAGLTTPGTLVFETDCRAGCAWDWSYWKDLEIDP
jgi:hypothetical protein